MSWNKYYFIYKNAEGKWYQATNPNFIAEHKCCEAIEKSEVNNLNYYLDKRNQAESKKAQGGKDD